MRTLLFLLRKEFRQIFRNKSLLPVIFAMPIIQLLVMPLAADYEVKNINISIVDHDSSPYSRLLANQIVSSGYFQLTGFGQSFPAAFQEIEANEADLVLEIPKDFERNLVRDRHAPLLIAINAINGSKAALGGVYLSEIISGFNGDIAMDWQEVPRFNAGPQIEVTSSNWFNPHLNYTYYMVPGILVILVTMLSVYMCSLNIVKEKELGTIEQINVTPIKKYHFILGKLIPFWVIGMVVFTVGLFAISWGIYGIRPVGNIALLYAYLALYLVAMLGLGLLISTYSNTQQEAMSVAFFFMMIFLLMSGLFTPIDGMPAWAKVIAEVNPVTYFIKVMRMVVLKGSGIADVSYSFGVMTVFALVFNGWAVLNYKKTS